MKIVLCETLNVDLLVARYRFGHVNGAVHRQVAAAVEAAKHAQGRRFAAETGLDRATDHDICRARINRNIGGAAGLAVDGQITGYSQSADRHRVAAGPQIERPIVDYGEVYQLHGSQRYAE